MALTISGFARLLAPEGYTNDIPVTAPEDTTPPAITLSTSNATVTQKQTITLTAVATDNVRVARVEFYNGETLIDTKTAAPYTKTITLTDANNGTYLFTAKAFDAKENTAESAAVKVTVNIVVIPDPVNYPFTMEAQLLAIYKGAIGNAVIGSKRMAGANAIVSAMKPDYRLYIYQENKLVIPIEFSGNLSVTNDGTDVFITLGAPDSSDPLIAAQLSQGTWHFELEGGASYARYIKGGVGAVGSGKLLTLSSDPEPGVGNILTFKLVVPRSVDEIVVDLPPEPIDTVAPTISLASSSTAVAAEERLILTATVEDNVKVGKVEFLRGDEVIAAKTEAPWTATQDLSLMDNGTILYTARASDLAGNVTTSSQVSVGVRIPTYVRLDDLTIDKTTSDLMATRVAAASTGTSFNGKRSAAATAVYERMLQSHRLYIYCDGEVVYDVSYTSTMIPQTSGSDVFLRLGLLGAGNAMRTADFTEGYWTFKVVGGTGGTATIGGTVGAIGSGANMILPTAPVLGERFYTTVIFVLNPALDGLT